MGARLKISTIKNRYQGLLNKVNRIVIKTELDVLRYKKMRERVQRERGNLNERQVS